MQFFHVMIKHYPIWNIKKGKTSPNHIACAMKNFMMIFIIN